jgi:predicted nucleic acid-binding protein
VNYLIDTNVISEVRKGASCDPDVARWYSGIDDAGLYLSAIVLGEIRRGVEKVRPRDPSRAHALEKWLADIGKAFGDRILSVDRAVADEWGRMSAIRTLPIVDALLAATAKVHGMTLVTRDAFDATDLGVLVLNPFAKT